MYCYYISRLAYKDYFMISQEADLQRSNSLKNSITQYFEQEDPVKDFVLPTKV